MASPSVETTSVGGDGSQVSSHTITLPSGIVSGDLVIVCFKLAGASDGGFCWPAGWYVFAGFDMTQIAYRDADGTEGASIVVTSIFASWASYICYRISGHADPDVQPPEGDPIIPANYRGLTSPEAYTSLVVVSEEGRKRLGVEACVELIGMGEAEADITQKPKDLTVLSTTQIAVKRP